MLASLTATAVRRGWPPAVYARLVSQLNDREESSDSRAILTALLALMTELLPSPLLFEYIAVLSTDVYSVLPFTTLIAHFASQTADSRPQSSIDLMAYLSRGIVAEWALSWATDQAELTGQLKILGDQAVQGCRESRLFMRAVFSHLALDDLPADLAAIAQQLTTKKLLKCASSNGSSNTDESNLGSADSRDLVVVDKSQHASSRSLRLLWLDWVLRTAQNSEFDTYLKPQLDIMWPGDRLPVLAYELCVTAFDCLAAKPHNDQSGVFLASAFITHRLPLLLREMAAGESLDGVVARLFTTLDKAVVEAGEKAEPGIRAAFGMACIDLQLCDPSVLHLLHRSHAPRELVSPMPDLQSLLSPTYSWDTFLDQDLVCQQHIARGLVKLARGVDGISWSLSRPALTNHCWQLFSNERLSHAVMVQIDVRDFLDCITVHADAAAKLPEEDGGAGQVYHCLGVLLTVLTVWHDRYHIKLDARRWSRQFIAQKTFGNLQDLDTAQQDLMGQWVSGLFLRTGSGIADDMLKPFEDLSLVLPVLLKQAVMAYRSAVIDQETLKTGLDYFMQPASVALLSPLAMRVFYHDLMSKKHVASSLQCIVLFLSLLAPKKGIEFTMTKQFLVPVLQDICEFLDLDPTKLAAGSSDTNSESDRKTSLGRKSGSAPPLTILDLKNPTIGKLIDELQPIISDLFVQVGCSPPPKSTQPLSYTELVTTNVTSLMNWQLKPQGVPPTPGYLISERIKPVLGVSKTRSLISSVLLDKSQSSLETYWAILVADTWWTPPSLLNADPSPATEFDNTDLQPAKELQTQLSRVFTHLAQLDLTRPEVRIAPPRMANPPTHDLQHPLNTTPPHLDHASMEGVELTGDSMSLGSNEAMNVDLAPTMNHNPTELTANAGASNEIGQRFNYAFDDAQRQDFDTDFSQPMNLADLDSAMDFAWD